MHTYALICRKPDSTTVIGQTKATTQVQATRKLYRANSIDPAKASQLGFAVEFQKPSKGA